MRALGYNVRAYKLAAFVIAAAFAGARRRHQWAVQPVRLAGIRALDAVWPRPWSWCSSAAPARKIGPIIGAAVVLLLQHWLSSYTQYWSLALGLLFIVLITRPAKGSTGCCCAPSILGGNAPYDASRSPASRNRSTASRR